MILIMADVIAFVADGTATRSTVYFILFYLFYFIYLFIFYFLLSSKMLNRASSHM